MKDYITLAEFLETRELLLKEFRVYYGMNMVNHPDIYDKPNTLKYWRKHLRIFETMQIWVKASIKDNQERDGIV
jgi:hypothetical protein